MDGGPGNDAQKKRRRERVMVVSLLLAIVATLSFAGMRIPVWLGWNLGHCERACRAGCERDRACGGYAKDCDVACEKRCARAESPAGKGTEECVKRIQALSCEDVARLGMGDISPVRGACGSI